MNVWLWLAQLLMLSKNRGAGFFALFTGIKLPTSRRATPLNAFNPSLAAALPQPLQEVWHRATPIAIAYEHIGLRQDRLGNWIKLEDYNNLKSPYGWQVAAIHPAAPAISTLPVGAASQTVLEPLHWQACQAYQNQAAISSSPSTPSPNPGL